MDDTSNNKASKRFVWGDSFRGWGWGGTKKYFKTYVPKVIKTTILKNLGENQQKFNFSKKFNKTRNSLLNIACSLIAWLSFVLDCITLIITIAVSLWFIRACLKKLYYMCTACNESTSFQLDLLSIKAYLLLYT